MTDKEIILMLCEFFFDEFDRDALNVGDWIAQGGADPDIVIEDVKKLESELKSKP